MDIGSNHADSTNHKLFHYTVYCLRILMIIALVLCSIWKLSVLGGHHSYAEITIIIYIIEY